jgi:hypothetical protein
MTMLYVTQILLVKNEDKRAKLRMILFIYNIELEIDRHISLTPNKSFIMYKKKDIFLCGKLVMLTICH